MTVSYRYLVPGVGTRTNLAACASSSGSNRSTRSVTASATRPMLFVRSGNGGVSHSPDEHSEPADIALAVDVLAAALLELAPR